MMLSLTYSVTAAAAAAAAAAAWSSAPWQIPNQKWPTLGEKEQQLTGGNPCE
ncbi:uncharacterized protein MEPE_01371 [Melanopsichium pennsylvanicum]|uniref:Secreted protein n=1 Tax=Melanopsichium pennsylvanicum TaxID=63383 RepID=A0AAJ5C3I7_9BASI|nr:uncharacterized protein MEPE_01371 [Melanopsichium pennsylvanicum]